jgi:hypothetical protein
MEEYFVEGAEVANPANITDSCTTPGVSVAPSGTPTQTPAPPADAERLREKLF